MDKQDTDNKALMQCDRLYKNRLLYAVNNTDGQKRCKQQHPIKFLGIVVS